MIAIEQNQSPPIDIGSPVWFRPEHSRGDTRCYIVMDTKPYFDCVPGDWLEIALESAPEGQRYIANAKHVTTEPPNLHAEHGGVIHFTATDRALRAIEGGRRDA